MEKRRLLRTSKTKDNLQELRNIEETLANKLGERYLETIQSEMENITDAGKVNTHKITTCILQ